MKAVGKEGKHPAPDLYDDLVFIWEVFCALSSSRSNFSSIKFSEIEACLNLNGIFDLERRQEVTHLIRIMDEEFLKFTQEKQSKNKGK